MQAISAQWLGSCHILQPSTGFCLSLAPCSALSTCGDRVGAAWCSSLPIFCLDTSAKGVFLASLAAPATSCWAQVSACTSVLPCYRKRVAPALSCWASVLIQTSRDCMYCPPAEGRHSSIVVVGEKARAQLVRDQRTKIVATIQDVNKLRITYAQVGSSSQVCRSLGSIQA